MTATRVGSILDPKWNLVEGRGLAVNLSIKNVPDQLAQRLRERAARSHRSIQGELMAILETALGPGDRLTPDAVLAQVRKLKLSTGDEAARIVRSDRDGR